MSVPVSRQISLFAFIMAILARGSSAFARPLDAAALSTRLVSSSLSLSVEEYNELPTDFPRRDDALVALAAVRKACAVTIALQPELQRTITTVSKLDLSPVTVGDFAAQAIVLKHLRDAFEQDSFIAEESSQALSDDDTLANQVLAATSMGNIDILKRSIDLGKEYELWKGNTERPSRVWSLDPIDGTKGFLRGKREGGQYCVALALLENGVPTIGILGCPNLPASPTDFNYVWGDDETAENNRGSRGCIFVASEGGGCYQLPYLPGAPGKQIQVTPNDSTMKPKEGRFCIGVEKFSDALGQGTRTAQELHGEYALTDDGEIVNARRIDSQAKYGILSRAGAEYYARFTKPGYVEWIWDHAAGSVVLTEAGGKMTDLEGRDIDFSLGAKMSDTVDGVLGSNGGKFHTALVDAFQSQESERINSQ